mmetsp:Transcript_13852/g.21000  ORF Transcript_13852/g.21000 Transcript_13852/m.21000 type:complete len:204 (-) Transcript_13852:372-983(-)
MPTRWVQKPTSSYNMLCNYRGCTKICHECKHNQDSIAGCFVFCQRNRQRMITLNSARDRDLLAACFETVDTWFGPENPADRVWVTNQLLARRGFQWGNETFLAGAGIKFADGEGPVQLHHLTEVASFPCTFMIVDRPDPHTCMECHHGREYHYRAKFRWVEEEITRPQLFLEAINIFRDGQSLLERIQEVAESCFGGIRSIGR